MVPDSEDEAWDSEESQPLPTSARLPSAPKADPRSDDVWEFPETPSPPRTRRLEPHGTQRLTIPPPSTELGKPGNEASQILGEQQDSSAPTSIESDTARSEPARDSPDPLADEFTEARPDTPIGRRHDTSPGTVSKDAPPTGEASLGERDRRPASNSARHAFPAATQSVSPFRGRRSLRPRKPIQEHPYLLENAHYSRSMKTHGMKPVRVLIEEREAARRRNEEDSQDGEYNGDESQQESAGQTEESQVDKGTGKNQRRVDDDMDELALSPSPRTSSPQRHLRASSEPSRGEQTDHTSVNDDDEFPDVTQLLGKKNVTYGKFSKRQTPSGPPTSRKRLKTGHSMSAQESPLRRRTDVWELPLSPPPPTSTSRIRSLLSPSVSPHPSASPRVAGLSDSPLRQLSPAVRPGTAAEPVDLTKSFSEVEDGSAQGSDNSSSESDAAFVRKTGKRIRGVLPASWLRLDQQTRKEAPSTVRRQSRSQSPGQPRPGLAVRKYGTPWPGVSTKTFFEEMNEDDDDDEAQRESEQLHADLERESMVAENEVINLDDGASVVEEDFVDWMLPGQKRSRTSSSVPPRKRQKTHQKVFNGEERKRYRQQKISYSVHGLDRPPAKKPRPPYKSIGRVQAGRSQRAISPPALSIVDNIEPNAPKFIRVAARTANKRNDMGRCKPSNKNINLGNRTDNVDALSVLEDWTAGKIMQKNPKEPRLPPQQKLLATRPLRSVSVNVRAHPRPRSGLSLVQPQKLKRQASMDNFVSVEVAESPPKDRPAKLLDIRRTNPHSREDYFRPAQLEADVLEVDGLKEGSDSAFTAGKKVRDLLFRKSRREVLAPTFSLRRPIPDEEPAPIENLQTPSKQAFESAFDILKRPANEAKAPRIRKLVPPKRLDLEAPQFRHANDPLPFFDQPAAEETPVTVHHGRSKITRLGPFVTHYTQHFDVFPLHQDTFFHHTTIIGSGTLKKALEYQVSDAVGSARTPISFDFSNHRFNWGRWTDETSSEFGLLFDILGTNLEEGRTSEVTDCQAVQCADHILKFILDAISVEDVPQLRLFVERLYELLFGFLNLTSPSTPDHLSGRTLLQIHSRLLICALILLRVCHGTVELSSEVLQAEDLLKRFAKVVIEKLLEIGLSEVRANYDDLQRLAIRERGIRADSVAITCWVIAIQVLGSAQIPRAGLWDLAGPAMTVDAIQTNDAQRLECVWSSMFTLLPLGEFDDSGVLSKGMRHVAPLQGWSLPQKLLKVVFESYQNDRRQSPCFNEYCRALLGRCHYLIEQWGWHRCVSIVGTIFDFFGSQNLSHLRNEEVYKSPRFLEELSDGPCLSIEPEDRCFHIFLKILAVAIQNMRRAGLSNDIRNLVARCLPNHNRQYSKEQTIQSHDLASLRNHHDLLCCLFWSSPPEDRRPVDLIEKLVQPASSHKEACLINLRAWSQLARFVISSGGSLNDYRPFMSWQNNVFQQVLNQYLSAAADVQNQFMSMAKEDRIGVQQQRLDGIIAANQAATKDILHFSVIASLDVMKQCPSLNSATFSFNVNQMNKAFSKLSTENGDLDWGIMRACFDTIDLFVKRLEDLSHKSGESTNDSITSHGSCEFEDVVEFLDDKIVLGFFAAVCRAMSSPACGTAPQPGSASLVVKKAIVLCGRIASLLINAEKRQLQHFFSPGKYGVFQALPDQLSLADKRFVPLFVATLLKNHVFDFSSIGCSHFDVWISSLVKPFHALRYENYLAETLMSMEMGYIKGAIVKPGVVPDYNSNRDFLTCGVSYMRRELRQADPVQRKSLRANYEKLLKSIMQQMKTYIESLKLDSIEHQNYISFVREVVGLIKSHGADICKVDDFYYQFSAEYSPAKEDPQLHTAGILAYGLRLGEGDTTAAPQLFYYLYNHFKSALVNGQLNAETKIVVNAMKDDKILAFIIGRMLPAIVRASSTALDIWPLLDVYAMSLRNVLNRSFLPREVPESCLEDVVTLLTAVLGWARGLVQGNDESTGLTPAQAYVLTELVGICNALRPSLVCWLMQPSVDPARKLQKCVGGITRVAKKAASVLDELRASRGSEIAIRDVSVKALIGSNEAASALNGLDDRMDDHAKTFKQSLMWEVQNSWVVTPELITVRVAATSSAQPGTQSTQGVKNDLDKRLGLLTQLLDSLKVWSSDMGDEENGTRKRRRRIRRYPRATAVAE